MTAIDRNDPLLAALRAPASLARLSEADWAELLRRARRVKLDARIGYDVEAAALMDRVPAFVRERLALARLAAEDVACTMAWEVDRIERALAGLDVPHLYLKGPA